MPIDPNIALGIRPIEQPNMLGQMAQAMAIRQANQEYENEGGLRNALVGGATEDPSSLLQYGKSGRATYESILKGKKEQLESSQKRIDMMGGLAGFVRERPTSENFESSLTQAVSYGLMTPAQKQETIAKYGGSPESIRAYADQSFQSALTAKDRTANETRLEASRISAAPGHRNASIVEQRFAIEKAQQAEVDALMRGGASSAAPAVPMTGGGGVPNALAPNATPAPTNMLMPGAQAPATAGVPAAAAPVGDVYAQIQALDAKIAPLVNSGNPRATAIVQQLIAQRNALMQSAKQMYSGQETTMATTDPKTGLTIVVKARPNEYGVLVPIEMTPVPLSTDASGTGSTGISPTVARPAPSAPVWNEKTNTWMTPPTPENPKGTAVENPEVRNIVQTRAANATLKVAGYDPKTGTDEVSSLIKKSTSGLGENWANKAWSAITGTGSEGAEAIAKLETRANEMTLALAPNGSLGAGFSNEDRNFMLGKLGDVANPNKPMNVRLAAWEDVMERTARNAGVPYTKQSYGGSSSSKPAASGTTLPKGFKLD